MSVVRCHRSSLRGRGPGRRSASSSGRRARPTDRIGTASCGVRRRWSWRLIRAWRSPAAPSRAASVASRCFSLPYTLSHTVACARSDVVSTPVTVTNPIRGSFSVGIVSETTALIASSTRRIRGVRVERPSHRGSPDRARGAAARTPAPTSQRSAVSSSRSASPASRATHASVNASPLPRVVVVDLGDRARDPVRQLRLHGPQVHALLLQRVARGEVELERVDADEARCHASIEAARRRRARPRPRRVEAPASRAAARGGSTSIPRALRTVWVSFDVIGRDCLEAAAACRCGGRRRRHAARPGRPRPLGSVRLRRHRRAARRRARRDDRRQCARDRRSRRGPRAGRDLRRRLVAARARAVHRGSAAGRCTGCTRLSFPATGAGLRFPWAILTGLAQDRRDALRDHRSDGRLGPDRRPGRGPDRTRRDRDDALRVARRRRTSS